jgi:hypothetical protein
MLYKVRLALTAEDQIKLNLKLQGFLIIFLTVLNEPTNSRFDSGKDRCGARDFRGGLLFAKSLSRLSSAAFPGKEFCSEPIDFLLKWRSIEVFSALAGQKASCEDQIKQNTEKCNTDFYCKAASTYLTTFL